MRALRLRHDDPGRLALRKAARAAIVIPVVVAVADKVIQQPQTTIFAAFGSFALLALADFRGPPRRGSCGDRTRLEGLAVLLAGATRLRLAADSLWSLADGSRGGAHYVGALDTEVRQVRSWYTALGEAVGEAQVPPPPDDGGRERRVRVLSDARETAAADHESGPSAALALLWAAEHLDTLRSLELQLVGPAGELAGEAPRGLRI